MLTPDPFIEANGSEEKQLLWRSHVLPVYQGDGRQLLLKEDAADVAAIEAATAELSDSSGRLFPLAPKDSLGISPDGRLDLLEEISHPALGPALRSLARQSDRAQGAERAIRWLPGTTIISDDKLTIERAQNQAERVEATEHLRAPDLAGATSYMGSKRELASFLVEAVFAETEGMRDVSVLDLMCGSGASAAAFASYWPTFASDAQQFSVLLARSQGGGMTAIEARDAIDDTLRIAAGTVDSILEVVEPFVAREDEFLHSGDRSEAVRELKRFIADFPRVGMRGSGSWAPTELVDRARADPAAAPPVLFSAYFANVYFGVRQCVEIDGLRVAVQQLEEPLRSWALAALVASVASVATTYGGHFAQPRIASPEQVNEKNISRLIEQRSASVVHEFAARLLNLAAESEETAFPVVGLSGPWQDALASASEVANPRRMVIYLDPPYRREEYSRYYHVLETLVRYDYPGIQDTGLAPPKGPQRFRSEFFTRSAVRRERLLADVISEVLRLGAKCAWSYADTADGSIPNVVRDVAATTGAKVTSYSTRHRHRAHGGRQDKQVTEYLIWFHPRRT